MSSIYSFNTYTGEIQTSTNTFPIRLTFGNTLITPLVSNFSLNTSGEMNSKIYLQGGPGMSIHAAANRRIAGSFSIPIRITENKELESIIKKIIEYCFFDPGSICSPQIPKYFKIETGYFKTAQGFLVPPGASEWDYNKEFIQIKINRCIIKNFTIEAKSDSEIILSIEFSGTINKDVDDPLFSSNEESQITEVKSAFDINKVATIHDCKILLNGSYVPNCNQITFGITKEIIEKPLSRSMNALYSSIIPAFVGTNSSLNYANDFPAKIGVKSFEAKITMKQVMRRINENIYYSRGGRSKNISGFSSNFIEIYYGPIKIARPCALAQQSDQPFGIGAIERTTIFTLLNKPIVTQSSFISVITGGIW
jgi:hypothetical protein